LFRRRYGGAEGSVTPADDLIDAAGRTVSLGVVELACRLSLDAHSFERAAGNLLAAARLQMSSEKLREVVESEGKLLQRAQECEQLEFDWHASDCRIEGDIQKGCTRATTRVYVGSDVVQVPTVTEAEKLKRRAKAQERRRRLPRRRGVRRRPLPAVKRGSDQTWKEFKLVVMYDQDQRHRLVRSTRRNHKHAGKIMRQMSALLRLRAADEKIALVDGAEWIRKQMQQNLPCLDVLTLDCFHLAQHVHQTASEVFGEGEESAKQWAERVMSAMKHEGYQQAWEILVELRTRTRARNKRKAIDHLMHYVAERRAMLNYVLHYSRGWDIGSGPTESMCKALTRRLKGRGMRWDADNAEAVMALEALMQSDGWDKWWQQRLLTLN
jgi:hypothetical protein